MKLLLFIMLVFGSKGCKQRASEDESETSPKKLISFYQFNFSGSDTKRNEKKTDSEFIGVRYVSKYSKWQAVRWSKNERRLVSNGLYDNEETAAHASDTVARKLMAKGENNHKLNFPDDETVVCREEKKTSKYIGVSYNEKTEQWSCV
jgi:hypothetical protein